MTFRWEMTTPVGVRVDPEVGNFTVTSPRVAVEACDDISGFISNGCSEQLAVKMTGRFGVELVDAVHEECFQRLAFGFVEQYDSVGLHDRQESV